MSAIEFLLLMAAAWVWLKACENYHKPPKDDVS
jgi:hypothetical protein